MKRRTSFLGCLFFLAGLLALDVALIQRHDGLHHQVDRVLRDQLRVDWSYDDVGFEFHPLRGPQLVIDGLMLTRAKGSTEPGITARRVALGLDYSALYEGWIELERVEITDPVVHLYWKDEELDLDSPFRASSGQAGQDLPSIDARGLAFHLHDPPFIAADLRDGLVINPIEIKLERSLSKSYPYRFQGEIKDQNFGTFEISGNLRNDKIRGKVTRKNLRLEPSLVGMFDESTREMLANIEMEGGVDLELHFRSEEASDRVRLKLVMAADEVVIRHHRLPTQVSELEGVFELSNGVVRANPLRFELNGAEVRVKRGVLRLPTEKEKLSADVEARITALDVGKSFVDSIRNIDEEPFTDIKEALEAFGTQGLVNLDLALKKVPDQDGLIVDANVVLDTVSLAYEGYVDPDSGERIGYPYRIRDLYGHVHIDNSGIEFDELITRSRHDFVKLDGAVTFGEEPGFEVNVNADNIELNENVRSALPPAERQVYDDYAPGGRADLRVHVSRRPGQPASATKVEVDIDMRLVEARPAVFPMKVESIGGQLRFRKGQPAQLHDIRAERDGGSIELSGQIDFGGERASEALRLKLKANNLELDDELVAAIAVEFPEVAAEMRRQEMRGRFDLDVNIDSGAVDQSRFDLTLRGMHMRLAEAPSIPLEDIRGRAEVADGELRLRDMRFRALDRALEGSGEIDLGENSAWRIAVSGRDLDVDPALISGLAREIDGLTKIERRFDVFGKIDLDLSLKKNRRGELVRSDVKLKGFELRDRTSPLVFRDVNGRVATRDREVTLQDLSAEVPWFGESEGISRPSDQATFSLLSATLRPEEQLDLVASGLVVKNLVLRDEVVDLFPESARKELKALGLRGRLDFELSSLRSRKGRTIFRGLLRPQNLRGETGMNLVLERADLEVESGEIEDGDFSLRGHLRRGAARIENLRLDEIDSPFVISNQEVRLDKLGARFLGGKLEAPGTHFAIDFEHGRSFAARVSALEVDLSEMLRQLGGRPSAVKGRANLNAGLGGRLGDFDSFVGEATVKMTGRALYELPFFTTVFQIINFDFLTTSSNEPQRGALDLRVRDRAFLLDRARFEGPGINLDGSGRAGFDGIIDLAFEPKPIKWVDSIPIVGDLFEIGSGIIVDKVHLTGPIENPSARVGNYITELLPTEEDSGRRLIIRPLKGGETKQTKEEKRKP